MYTLLQYSRGNEASPLEVSLPPARPSVGGAHLVALKEGAAFNTEVSEEEFDSVSMELFFGVPFSETSKTAELVRQ